MSLRQGHLRSRQWAPPTHIDDWRDEAKCAGMNDDMFAAAICDGCPVVTECAALFDEMSLFLDNGTQRAQKMVGTYGGVHHPASANIGGKYGGRWPKGHQPINGGACAESGCDEGAYRRGLCSKHYQRLLRMRAS